MAATTEETVDRVASGIASDIDTRVSVGGAMLAIGSLLLVVGFVLHPPPSPDPAEFMATIAENPT